ncbi:unnamed protein product [Sphagnum balticum]
MSITTYWCCKSHWITSAEPKAKLLQVVPNELLDPIADQISLPVGVRVLVRGGSKAALNGAPAGVYTSNVVYREVLQ